MKSNLSHIALVISDSGILETVTIITEKPKAREILVSPLRVGICGTDLQIYRRARRDPATIVGHEGIAEIVDIGSNVTDFFVGQKVVFNPVNPNNQNDILGHSTQGLFQQRLLISQSAIERGLVVPFDPRIPLVCGPLVEPLGTIIYGQSLVHQVCNPQYTIVYGAGPIGLLHALYARMQNCPNIFLISNSKERLDWAVEREIIRSDEAFLDSPQLYHQILALTGGRGADAAYLCTTRQSAIKVLKQALKCTRDGGCIDLVGGFSDGDSIFELPITDLNSIRRANLCGFPNPGVVRLYQTTNDKQVWLTGHRGTSEIHLKVAMKLLYEAKDYFTRVISHIVSLHAVPSIFEHLVIKNSKNIQGREFVKSIIDLTIEGFSVKFFEVPQPW